MLYGWGNCIHTHIGEHSVTQHTFCFACYTHVHDTTWQNMLKGLLRMSEMKGARLSHWVVLSSCSGSKSVLVDWLLALLLLLLRAGWPFVRTSSVTQHLQVVRNVQTVEPSGRRSTASRLQDVHWKHILCVSAPGLHGQPGVPMSQMYCHGLRPQQEHTHARPMAANPLNNLKF